MNVVLTSGGTAGHIYPALAVALRLIEQGHTVHFAGSPQGPEHCIIPEAHIPYTGFEARGFNRAKPFTLLTSTALIAKSTRSARHWLEGLAPAVVAGFGGYVSIPVGLAASRLRIPLLIHEQNSSPGMANSFLAKRAAAVALTYPDAAARLQTSGFTRVTGCPVRPGFQLLAAGDKARALARSDYRAELGIPADAILLMVFGGSQGALHLNQVMVGLACNLLRDRRLHVLHITGRRDFQMVTQRLAEESGQVPERWHLVDYCEQMPEAYAAADLVVSRSGASSLAEIAAMGLPSLLVPFPQATDDHQTANARSLVQAGAALSVADSELEGPGFSMALEGLLADADKRASMAQAALRVAGGDATQAVIDMLNQIAK